MSLSTASSPSIDPPSGTDFPRHVPPTLREIVRHPDYAAARQDPEDFFSPEPGFHSPLLIPGLEEAVDVLGRAIEDGQSILVLGDRDVDGVSSTALLGNFLKEMHDPPKLDLRVSDEGDDYGLSGRLFEDIRDGQADVVILLDMGSSHGPEVETLVKRGKAVIILDHHQLHDRVPDPERCAFVNPMRDPESVGSLEHEGKIATVGLVFKLLLGYALAHTREWQRVYYLTEQEDETAVLAYRCGCFLGRFTDLAAGQAAIPQWEWCNLKDEAAYCPRPGERARFMDDPHAAGKLLLTRIILNRRRLLDFVGRIADLAAVGIMTDMVPLVGENRALVRLGIGLAGFRNGRRPYIPGYAALIRALGLPEDRIVSRDLGWSIGPALNAAGRMGNTRLALDLLTAERGERASKLATELVKLNEERKKRTARNEGVVARLIAEDPARVERPLVFCYHKDLEPGVSGIVATRLTERYERPVVYVNPDGDYARGSARSFGGVNVLDLLSTAAELFIQFGGHPEAAGFSIQYDNIPKLEAALLDGFVKMQSQEVKSPPPANVSREYHLEVRPAQLSYDLLRELELLEPFGPRNPEPVFRVAGAVLQKVKYMTQGLHAKFSITGGPVYLECVAWRQGKLIADALEKDARGRFDLYGSLEMSYFAGRSRLQFRVDGVEVV